MAFHGRTHNKEYLAKTLHTKFLKIFFKIAIFKWQSAKILGFHYWNPMNDNGFELEFSKTLKTSRDRITFFLNKQYRIAAINHHE